MRQRNVTGYTLVVTPPEGPDGTAAAPFELAAGEEIDYPNPIPGCAAEPPAPADPPSEDAPKPRTKAKSADGGDQK